MAVLIILGILGALGVGCVIGVAVAMATNNILRKNLYMLWYTSLTVNMADFTLLMEKFDRSAVADQAKEWARELDDEARARESLSLDAAEQLEKAKVFYEANVDFVNEQHAARLAALRDIPAAVEQNEALAEDQVELKEYLSAPERQEFMQKMRELSAMDKELREYLLSKGLLGRPPVSEETSETVEEMPENPLME